jgi:AP-2 complex subunit alpha
MSWLQWYVDVVLALLERAGDFCSDDVWHRMVQLVTNNEGSQSYAAEQVMEVLQRGASHEALVCLAAYTLGEYGKLIRVRFATLLKSIPSISSNPCAVTCRKHVA